LNIKINHIVFFFKTSCLIILILFPLFISSQEKEIDSIQNDTVNETKFLLDKVNRKAKGFIKINNNKKTILLYDNAELRYMNIELKAGIIECRSPKHIKRLLFCFFQLPTEPKV